MAPPLSANQLKIYQDGLLSSEEVEHFRLALIDLRTRLQDNMRALRRALTDETPENTGESAAGEDHPGDLGTQTFDQERNIDIMENEQSRIYAINEALVKIPKGEYGYCEKCKQPISKSRLEALPYAKLCVDCQEARERP